MKKINDLVDVTYYPMSNKELADAITAANNRSGTIDDTQLAQTAHLKELLAVQLVRAKSVVVGASCRNDTENN